MSKIDLKLNFDEILKRIDKEKQGFRPSEWARKIGVSKNIVTNVHGKVRQKPSLEYIVAVSKAVSRPVEYFLWGEQGETEEKYLETDELLKFVEKLLKSGNQMAIDVLKHGIRQSAYIIEIENKLSGHQT